MAYEIIIGHDCDYCFVCREIGDIIKRLNKRNITTVRICQYEFKTRHCSVKFSPKINIRRWAEVIADYSFNPPFCNNDKPSSWRTTKIEEAYNSTNLIALIDVIEEAERVKKSICHYPPIITKVIFNEPATIVFWSDGVKTVVKAQEDDNFDKEKGLAMAIAKKYLGTNYSCSNYYDVFKQWIPQEDSVSFGVSSDELGEALAKISRMKWATSKRKVKHNDRK